MWNGSNKIAKTITESPKPKDPEIREFSSPETLSLRFSPYAFAKIMYFSQNENKVEISGFGIGHKEDPLFIDDFYLVKQTSRPSTFKMDVQSIADNLEGFADKGIQPYQSMRVWIHTHPGFSPTPSSIDEETFSKEFGTCNWAVMCIVSSDMGLYAKLRLGSPLVGTIKIPVLVDWTVPIEVPDYHALAEEYKKNVIPQKYEYLYEDRAGSIWTDNEKETSIIPYSESIDGFIPLYRNDIGICDNCYNEEAEIEVDGFFLCETCEKWYNKVQDTPYEKKEVG